MWSVQQLSAQLEQQLSVQQLWQQHLGISCGSITCLLWQLSAVAAAAVAGSSCLSNSSLSSCSRQNSSRLVS